MTKPVPTVANILAVYNQASPKQIQDGLNWYNKAQHMAVNFSNEFSIPVFVAAGVLAALSPRNKWERNVKDARTVLSGTPFYMAKVCTFNLNKIKAYAILEATSLQDVEEILSSQKLLNFFRNIADPEGDAVTIDFHALSIACNYRYTSDKAPKMSSKFYKQIQDLYIEAAETVDILPSQMQAITWVVWREMA